MSTELVQAKPASMAPSAPAFTREQVDLIKKTVAKGATDDELKLFLYTCEKRRLDPLARQIYFQKRRNNKTGEDTMTVLTAIDGYRLTAARTGVYAGNDEPVFDDEKNPRKATVTVYKIVKGNRCAFTASARWDAYYPGDSLGFMWRKMPHTMLGKCAEALALRKAFPEELGGMYIPEEMEQAGEPIKYEEPKPVQTMAAPEIYDNTDVAQQKGLGTLLKRKKVDEVFWETIGARMHQKSKDELDNVIAKVIADAGSI